MDRERSEAANSVRRASSFPRRPRRPIAASAGGPHLRRGARATYGSLLRAARRISRKERSGRRAPYGALRGVVDSALALRSDVRRGAMLVAAAGMALRGPGRSSARGRGWHRRVDEFARCDRALDDLRPERRDAVTLAARDHEG